MVFRLVLIKDLIRVEPGQLNATSMRDDEQLRRVVGVQIRRKYCNRVLLDVGLCVTLHEVRSIGEGSVAPGMGATMFLCHFTLVVFRPRVGDVLWATPLLSQPDGLLVSTGFFQDIHIVPEQMPIPNKL